MNQKHLKYNAEDFFHQFPHHEKHVAASEGYVRPDWFEVMDGVPEDHTREPVSYARGGDVMHTRKVPKPHTPMVGEKPHKPHHPAMMIPGIHVIEGIHGIPYFTGKK